MSVRQKARWRPYYLVCPQNPQSTRSKKTIEDASAVEGNGELDLWLQLSVARRPIGYRAGRHTRTARHSLADEDRGEKGCIREEHEPEPGCAGQHHEMTHPPENHLQSRRRGVSIGPLNQGENRRQSPQEHRESREGDKMGTRGRRWERVLTTGCSAARSSARRDADGDAESEWGEAWPSRARR